MSNFWRENVEKTLQYSINTVDISSLSYWKDYNYYNDKCKKVITYLYSI